MTKTDDTVTVEIMDLLHEETYVMEDPIADVRIVGIVHDVDAVGRVLQKDMNVIDPDVVMYEEDLKSDFCPEYLEEHEAIQEYSRESGTPVESMDLADYFDELDCIWDIVKDMIPCDSVEAYDPLTVRMSNLKDPEGMSEHLAALKAENPELYTFNLKFRNEIMARQIYQKATTENVEIIYCVTGQSHVFGDDKIQNQLLSIAGDSYLRRG